MTIVAATYPSGCVFGDASIQKQYYDALKCLSRDKQYLETTTDDVYCLRFPKTAFISAIFAEIRVELMYKLMLFHRTPFFKELSPYSLITFASLCEVKSFKYGEIIVTQGEKPDACYLLVHGSCKALYPVPRVPTHWRQQARKEDTAASQ